MDKLTLLLEVLKDYDLTTLIAVGIGYLFIHKKINIVDRAVNQRPVGSATVSDDCMSIKSDLHLIKKDIVYIKKIIDKPKGDDDSFNVDFLQSMIRIEQDINIINKKL